MYVYLAKFGNACERILIGKLIINKKKKEQWEMESHDIFCLENMLKIHIYSVFSGSQGLLVLHNKSTLYIKLLE